jgi:hypothetical protein
MQNINKTIIILDPVFGIRLQFNPPTIRIFKRSGQLLLIKVESLFPPSKFLNGKLNPHIITKIISKKNIQKFSNYSIKKSSNIPIKLPY